MPIQHWIPNVSQEFKVGIDIICIYDRVLHVRGVIKKFVDCLYKIKTP